MRSGPTKAELIPLIIADIFQLAGEFRQNGENIAQMVGQTQARWQVLSAVSAEPRTVPQIARRLGVTRQAVQRLANLLQGDGSAQFAPNPDHKGSPHLMLSPKGRSVLAQLTEAAGHCHQLIAGRLGDDEVVAVHQGLRRLISALSQLIEEE